MATKGKAWEFVESYFEDGEKCGDCDFHLFEPDVNHHECQCDRCPTDCPGLPDKLYPPWDEEKPVEVQSTQSMRG